MKMLQQQQQQLAKSTLVDKKNEGGNGVGVEVGWGMDARPDAEATPLGSRGVNENEAVTVTAAKFKFKFK